MDNSPVKSDKPVMDEIPVKIGRQTKFISGVNDFTKCSVSNFWILSAVISCYYDKTIFNAEAYMT